MSKPGLLRKTIKKGAQATGLGATAFGAKKAYDSFNLEPSEEQEPAAPPVAKPEQSSVRDQIGQPPVPKREDPLVKLYERRRSEVGKELASAKGKQRYSSLEELQNYIAKQYEGLEEQDRKWIQEKRDRFDEMYQAARELKDEQMTRAQWAEVAETFAHAFARLGAAMSGLKSGVDLSTGLKFNKVNWDRQFNRIADRYNDSIKDIGRQESDVEQEEKRAASLRREGVNKDIQLLLQEYSQNRRAVDDVTKRRRRNEEDLARAQKQNNKEEIRRLEKEKKELAKGPAAALLKKKKELELARGVVSDLKEGRGKDDANKQKLRKHLINAGFDNKFVEEGLEKGEGFFWDDWSKLETYLNKSSQAINLDALQEQSREQESAPGGESDREKLERLRAMKRAKGE